MKGICKICGKKIRKTRSICAVCREKDRRSHLPKCKYCGGVTYKGHKVCKACKGEGIPVLHHISYDPESTQMILWGEHDIITKLNNRKKTTAAFREVLEDWMRKVNIVEIPKDKQIACIESSYKKGVIGKEEYDKWINRLCGFGIPRKV